MIPWRTVTILSTVLKSLVLVSYPIGTSGPSWSSASSASGPTTAIDGALVLSGSAWLWFSSRTIDSSADFRAADDSKPASSNVMGSEYPRVHSDSRVTFRVTAPDAQKGQVQMGQRFDMGK